MSATDEELTYVKDNEMDHVTYTLIVLSTFSPLFIIADRHAPHSQFCIPLVNINRHPDQLLLEHRPEFFKNKARSRRWNQY